MKSRRPQKRKKKVNPYEQGVKDFVQGNYKKGNPYAKDTENHRHYEHGFNRAYFKHKEDWEAKNNSDS